VQEGHQVGGQGPQRLGQDGVAAGVVQPEHRPRTVAVQGDLRLAYLAEGAEPEQGHRILRGQAHGLPLFPP
jgi:hypothetical protein